VSVQPVPEDDVEGVAAAAVGPEVGLGLGAGAGAGNGAAQPLGGAGVADDDGAAGESADDDHARVARVLDSAFGAPQRASNLQYSAPTVDGEGGVERTGSAAAGGGFANASRNAPCPCGSGRKYKRCHGAPQNA
jgi:preprotein translocase subunit SecA